MAAVKMMRMDGRTAAQEEHEQQPPPQPLSAGEKLPHLLQLPAEVLLHALGFLSSPRDMAAVVLSCSDLCSVVLNNRRLSQLLRMVVFDTHHSIDVHLQEDRTVATCSPNMPPGCPTWRRTTAFVVPPASDRDEVQFYHFKLIGPPASKFCFAISSRRPEAGAGSSASDIPQWDLSRDSLFIAYYFRSGSLHSYGSPALYRREAIETAKYAKGDVITIQLGIKNAMDEWPLPKPNWPLQLIDRFGANRATQTPKRHPYAVIYKNYHMVHDPLEFTDLHQWPIYVGVSFTTASAKEAVQIVCPPEGVFDPIFPLTES